MASAASQFRRHDSEFFRSRASCAIEHLRSPSRRPHGPTRQHDDGAPADGETASRTLSRGLHANGRGPEERGKAISSSGVATVAHPDRCHGGAARSVIPPPPELPGLPLRHLLRGTPSEHNSSGQQCQPSDQPNHHQVERQPVQHQRALASARCCIHRRTSRAMGVRLGACALLALDGPARRAHSALAAVLAGLPALMTTQEGQLSHHLRGTTMASPPPLATLFPLVDGRAERI